MNQTVIAERSLTRNDWPLVEAQGLTLIKSPLLNSIANFQHAFTTRLGGSTPAPMESFNLGRHWPTEESRVEAMVNRKRLCEVLALNHEHLTVPGQQHTTNIFVLHEGAEKGLPLPSYDGVATQAAGHPIMLHFADCVPVIVVDPVKRCVCVMHAGWRGTAGGIVTKGVKLLSETMGSKPQDMYGAVGPAIGSCCYETGSEVPDKLSTTVSNPQALITWKDDKPHPDLKAFNAMQLYEAGVQNVDVAAWCTACRPDLFYSHRQSGGKTGRQAAVASLL
jgi:YfiH family protein